MSVYGVILAGGKEARFEKGDKFNGAPSKPLMEIDTGEASGPVLFHGLYALGRMGIKTSETIIVANPHNIDAIRKAVGDTSIKFAIQDVDSLSTGPAATLNTAFRSYPIDTALVAQADDLAWNQSILRPTLEHYIRRQDDVVASMALIPTGYPGLHNSTYEVNASGIVHGVRPGVPERKHTGQGCNAGVHVERRDTFGMTYRALASSGENDISLVDIANFHLMSGLGLAGPIFQIPWMSANTLKELESARAVAAVAAGELVMPTVAETMAINAAR